MANQTTWDGFNEKQQELLKSIFGEPRIDPTIPDGVIELVTEDGRIEKLSPEEFLGKAERLAMAKEIREQLNRKGNTG